MKKLILRLDDLTVDSFPTHNLAERERGTVQGHYGTNHTEITCNLISCRSGCHTCLCFVDGD